MREDLTAVLDVGSSKVACFIAHMDESGAPDVRGLGHRLCQGVKGGAVVDVAEAEKAIRAAVEQAERVAGETVDSVLISLSAGQLQSQIIEMDVEIAGHSVDQADISNVIARARHAVDPKDRLIVHAFPACFSIDDSDGIRTPIGMYGERLAVTMHVITAMAGPLRNLETAVQRAHLSVSRFVASPYASGLSTLVDDEMDLGAAIIDLGAGSTQIGVFAAGALIHVGVLPVGSGHITQDIARGLLTPIEHAERLKTYYGNAIASVTDDRETIGVPQLGETDVDDEVQAQIPRSMLTGIIQPRIEETFEMVRDYMEQNGFSGAGAHRVVLTGGGAQLPGIREVAQKILKKQVRLGRPKRISGLADATAGPTFSTCTGLLLYDRLAPAEMLDDGTPERNTVSGGRLARVGRWLRENF